MPLYLTVIRRLRLRGRRWHGRSGEAVARFAVLRRSFTVRLPGRRRARHPGPLSFLPAHKTSRDKVTKGAGGVVTGHGPPQTQVRPASWPAGWRSLRVEACHSSSVSNTRRRLHIDLGAFPEQEVEPHRSEKRLTPWSGSARAQKQMAMLSRVESHPHSLALYA